MLENYPGGKVDRVFQKKKYQLPWALEPIKGKKITFSCEL